MSISGNSAKPTTNTGPIAWLMVYHWLGVQHLCDSCTWIAFYSYLSCAIYTSFTQSDFDLGASAKNVSVEGNAVCLNPTLSTGLSSVRSCTWSSEKGSSAQCDSYMSHNSCRMSELSKDTGTKDHVRWVKTSVSPALLGGPVAHLCLCFLEALGDQVFLEVLEDLGAQPALDHPTDKERTSIIEKVELLLLISIVLRFLK